MEDEKLVAETEETEQAEQTELDLEESEEAGEEIAEGEEPPKKKTANEVIREQKKLRQEAEAKANRFAEELAEARRVQPQPVVTDDQRQFEAEQKELADSNIDPNRKWQIESNRAIRASRKYSENAVLTAQDISDKTNFELSCAGNKRIAAVKEETEKAVMDMRAKGQNAPREAVAYFLLGKKVASAKVVEKKQEIERGKLPGAKSDVKGKGNVMTEHEKRIKRLENVNI
jgi:hypothetical protein